MATSHPLAERSTAPTALRVPSRATSARSRRSPLACALAIALGVIGACGGSKKVPRETASAPAAAPEPAALEPTQIIFAMGGIENDFRKCFFRNPRDRGSVHVRWRADTSGVVDDTELVRSTVTTPDIENCLLERVADLRFGRLDAPSTGEWVFVFRLATPPEPAASARKVRKSSATKSDEGDDDDGESVRVEADSPGFLDPDRVAGVVQAGLPLIARCYRSGLSRQQELSGNVRLRFVIGSTGRIEQIEDRGSDLPDLFAVDCVAEGFHALRFPKPEGGPVHVSYRMRLN